MSRRQRSARDQAQRARVAREKTLRRRSRTRRAATVAAAAVTLAGAGTAGMSPSTAAATSAGASSALPDCTGATTPASSPENLTDVDGLLFFTAYDGGGESLWRSDGTAAGTVRLKDVGSDDDYEYDYGGGTSLAAVGDRLFFTVNGESGDELWRSDGTRAGTVKVRGFASVGNGYDGDYGGPSDGMVGLGDTLFFTADDGTHGAELWRSDGTRSGTVLVKDIGSVDDGDYYDNGPSYLTPVGDTLFFTAEDDTRGAELWRSDGTRSGTVLVKDVYKGSYSSSAADLVGVGDALYFQARDGIHGRELWTSDGTGHGTHLVKDIRPGARGADPDSLVDVAGTLFFAAEGADGGSDLWTSDGTGAGTVLVKDFAISDEYYGVNELTAVDDTLFFVASDGTHGLELWSSDGTGGGTVMVEDIRPGEYDGYPSELTEAGGALFFTARDGVHGRELWRSDGTEAGTAQVKDIDADSTGRSPESLTASAGSLYFAADDGAHGEELWRSDGTGAGTRLVEDINTGGAFAVDSDGDPNTQTGTLRVRVVVDGAGTIAVAPVGKRWIKRAKRDVTGSDSIRTSLTLEPTLAAKRELRRNGTLRVRARFTFTSCGGSVGSVTRHYTLRMR